MVYQKPHERYDQERYNKTPYPKKDAGSLVQQLLEGNASEELAKRSEDTDVYYLKDHEEAALAMLESKGKYRGVRTGYSEIDAMIGDFLPGEVFTLGGDTGHGKSLLAMNIALRVYKKYMLPVLMVNLELTEEQAIERFYHMSGENHDYAGILSQKNPEVSYQDIDVLMEKARAEGCCLVVIDHLHFFNSSFSDNQANVLSQIMKHFKGAAVKQKLPVLLLSHVTPTEIMDNEGNKKKTVKPGLHSFKGSRSIEQISDMVGFVFRDTEDPKHLEFYVRKNRSRELRPESVFLTQDGWRLLGEDESWQLADKVFE
jgi:replicative DNA helicase